MNTNYSIDRGFVWINNSYLNEDIKPIELHMIDKVLIESLKNDENIDLIKDQIATHR